MEQQKTRELAEAQGAGDSRRKFMKAVDWTSTSDCSFRVFIITRHGLRHSVNSPVLVVASLHVLLYLVIDSWMATFGSRKRLQTPSHIDSQTDVYFFWGTARSCDNTAMLYNKHTVKKILLFLFFAIFSLIVSELELLRCNKHTVTVFSFLLFYCWYFHWLCFWLETFEI